MDSLWTIGGVGVNQGLRLVTNITLARLLAPEIFGVMTIVSSLRVGFELLSDTGIGQNIVQNRLGAQPDFYNTAWTVQFIRGLILWLTSVITAPVIANTYGIPIIATILPIVGIMFVFSGFSSTSVFLLQKQMRVARRNLFDAFFDLISALVHIVLALISPTIWALVFGGVAATVTKSIASHFLIRGTRNRLHISRNYLHEILSFGKWIFFSTVAFFLASFVDRLYLGSVIPLALLGVYGVARTLADGGSMLASHLTSLIVFPYFSKSRDLVRAELRQKISLMRFKMTLLAAFGVAALASSSDFIVQVLYDSRYWDAIWMLPLLCVGSWFSILSNLNESALLGFGKPMYSAFANSIKLLFLIVGMPLAFKLYGVSAAVIVIMFSELARYFPVLLGAHRERFSFVMQDIAATLTMFMTIFLFDIIRWNLGLITLSTRLYDTLR